MSSNHHVDIVAPCHASRHHCGNRCRTPAERWHKYRPGSIRKTQIAISTGLAFSEISSSNLNGRSCVARRRRNTGYARSRHCKGERVARLRSHLHRHGPCNSSWGHHYDDLCVAPTHHRARGRTGAVITYSEVYDAISSGLIRSEIVPGDGHGCARISRCGRDARDTRSRYRERHTVAGLGAEMYGHPSRCRTWRCCHHDLRVTPTRHHARRGVTCSPFSAQS